MLIFLIGFLGFLIAAFSIYKLIGAVKNDESYVVEYVGACIGGGIILALLLLTFVN